MLYFCWCLNSVDNSYNDLNSIGLGYDETESDLLLLDISDNDEYIWTTNFDVAHIKASSTSNNAPTSNTISLVVGGVIVGLAMLSYGVHLYIRNQNRKGQSLIPEN